ncbi:HAD family hydrolase [Streptomyces ureilyticus]|uniref:HAD family hydrolase n=1 Tax=Streptomyces ureilyticus TaxID=1775131 RepID=UPI002E281889|nr:HAD family phosphatase [Streptomyces ureilyticus]
MDSETTEAELVTETNGALGDLVARVRHVVFDFDGPICLLFPGDSAERVARDQVNWLEERGLSGLLTEQERDHPDPHLVLSAVAGRHPGSDLVAELEELLTQQELRKVPRAWPTPYAYPLIRTWVAVGARMAIATNNSSRAVRKYLADRELTDCFAPHIYGRTQDLSLLKPHPHTLQRALNAMGAAPDSSVMIGDSPTDYAAAREMGMAFIGYARNEEVGKGLLEAGVAPQYVVESLDRLLHVVRGRS